MIVCNIVMQTLSQILFTIFVKYLVNIRKSVKNVNKIGKMQTVQKNNINFILFYIFPNFQRKHTRMSFMFVLSIDSFIALVIIKDSIIG